MRTEQSLKLLTEQITVSDVTVDVLRKNIKSIRLAIYPTGKIRISVPRRVPDDTIRSFIMSKLQWIKKHQSKQKNQKRLPPKEYKNMESHFFLGNTYVLNVIETNAPPNIILRSATDIDLYVRPNSSIAVRKAIMNEWYRTELKKLIPPLIEYWEKKMHVTVGEWHVKLMKTKWGTCNTQMKRIWINLELAKKPLHLLEYIIVHEMVHLLERHHNHKFRAYMQTFLPNWKQLKAELNKHPIDQRA